MKNVVVRSISGIIYIALIVGAIYFGEWPFIILTTIFALVGVLEYSKVSHASELTNFNNSVTKWFDAVMACCFTLCPLLLNDGGTTVMFITILFVMALYLLTRFCMAIGDQSGHAMLNVAKSVLGVFYVSFPLFILNFLYALNPLTTPWLILMMFIMIWLNDTGAFCFGSMLGKHRLCERLSPKKSWEGFWGGMGCCIVFGIIAALCFNYAKLNMIEWVILGIVVSLFSTWGDLFESMMKRTMHIKDSGNIIPGHGGILDRIDSLLFVAPATFIFYILTLCF